ncbi:MAG: glycosyltransferase family 2 protein [Candidatus Omnitrophota bacterium]
MISSNNTKVSIITVCLNSEKYIEKTIKSVLSQTYPNIEYVIIDGGSADRTLEIVERYKNRLGYFASGPDKGIYDAQNKGISLSEGQIISILNSDDYFYSNDAVEKAVEFFARNKAIDFVYGNMLCVNGDGSQACLKHYPRRLKKRHFLRDTLGHSATFFRREAFQRAGDYNTSYRISADYEWYLRALYKKGMRAAHCKRIFSVFNMGGLSGRGELFISEIDSIKKIYFTPSERVIGACFNFILCGDIFRFMARLLMRNNSYAFFRAKYRRQVYLKYAKYLSTGGI